MEPLIVAALITAFLAGIAALFAPCCIGVLLPAYFGSIFRQKRTVFLMTGVFFLGLLAVFLPLGLGVGAFGAFFKDYHNLIYIVASVLLLGLGISLLLGFHFSVPFSTKKQAQVTGAASVFVLGIFSGFATLCCAPVLAGALALSLLPGSVWWGGLYSAVYVLGMVFPLFIISYFIDKTDVMERVNMFKREISYRLFGREFTVSIANLVSGAVFVLMGLFILYYSLTGQLAMRSEAQLQMNILMARISDMVTPLAAQAWFQIAFFGVIIVLGTWIIFSIIRKRRKVEK